MPQKSLLFPTHNTCCDVKHQRTPWLRVSDQEPWFVLVIQKKKWRIHWQPPGMSIKVKLSLLWSWIYYALFNAAAGRTLFPTFQTSKTQRTIITLWMIKKPAVFATQPYLLSLLSNCWITQEAHISQHAESQRRPVQPPNTGSYIFSHIHPETGGLVKLLMKKTGFQNLLIHRSNGEQDCMEL